MKVWDIVTEAEETGAYQQMQQFVKANYIPGIPADQQVALALFKELQKQKAQNQQLSSELDAAEERIDMATQTGQLQSQELGMHRGELERERKAGAQQRATVDQLGQQYAQRSKASDEQIQDLSKKLEAVKTMPGVSQAAAKKLEQQIQELGKKSIDADKVQDLQQQIAAIQGAKQADDAAITDLVKQVKDAQASAAELEKTKQSLGQDIESQLAHFKEVEKNVASLRNELKNLETGYTETDATVFDLENEVHRLKTMLAARANPQMAKQMVTPNTAAAAPATPTPTPAAPTQSKPTNVVQLRPDPKIIGQRLVDKGVLKSLEENQMTRAIAWATGKTK